MRVRAWFSSRVSAASGRESEAYPASCVLPMLSRFRQLIAGAERTASCYLDGRFCARPE